MWANGAVGALEGAIGRFPLTGIAMRIAKCPLPSFTRGHSLDSLDYWNKSVLNITVRSHECCIFD